jgi:mannose-6-phosphate isomerase-like protein (cupin superfamily)
MNCMPLATHRSPEDTKALKIPELGLELTVRLGPEALSGAMALLETVNAAGFGPPLHRHREAEVFRVMEGAYLFEVDGNRFSAKAGDVVCVPGGAPHAFQNVSDRPSRQLVMMLPGMDAEKFFLGLATVLASPHADRAALNVFGEPWGVEFLGPPLAP